MVTASIRLRLMAALLAVGSLALVGCKQGIGGRCEQNTDCASGICGTGNADMASAEGKMCVAVAGGGTAGTSGNTDAGEDADVGTLYGPDAIDSAEVSEVHGEAGGQCDQQSALIYLDLPGGTDSISSSSATGACGRIPGDCVPVAMACQTAGCECRITLQVNPATLDASANSVCHIEAVSKSGGHFMRDLDFSAAGSCTALDGTVVVASFTSGGGPG
jgi:hypothetical protein